MRDEECTKASHKRIKPKKHLNLAQLLKPSRDSPTMMDIDYVNLKKLDAWNVSNSEKKGDSFDVVKRAIDTQIPENLDKILSPSSSFIKQKYPSESLNHLKPLIKAKKYSQENQKFSR